MVLKKKFTVTRGRGRGRTIGVPTINMIIPPDFSLDQGIYAGWLHLGKNKYPSAIHFGPRPTFKETDNSLEVYILEPFDREVPESVELDFMQYIRDVRDFPSISEMKAEIERDVAKIRQVLRIRE